MCNIFGSSGPSAQEIAAQQMASLRAQEDARQGAIAKGRTSIDNAFKQFDDPYFDKYTKSYIDAQDAPLADQYGIAKDKLISALAGRDTLESTAGANAFGQLDKTNADAQAKIGAAATDATNAFRGNVNNQKSNLYSQNIAAADPLAAATSAEATSRAIVAPQSQPSLGDVFSGVLSPLATASKTNSQSLYPSSFNGLAPISGQGSGVWG
jgi:hypothetical protein